MYKYKLLVWKVEASIEDFPNVNFYFDSKENLQEQLSKLNPDVYDKIQIIKL